MNQQLQEDVASLRLSRFYDNFRVARYIFCLEAIEPLVLPRHNKGNVLRGAFGSIFKQICCGATCSSCSTSPLRDHCAYASIFEPAPPKGVQRLSSFQDIPRPFVFRPPADERIRYERGRTFEFELLLIGDAEQYLPYFIVAFRKLSERGFGIGRGRCRLRSVHLVNQNNMPVSVYFHESQAVQNPASCSMSAKEIMGGSPDRTTRIEIEFVTPTHIKCQGVTIESPDFHHVIKRLRDRVNALACFFCGTSLDLDFADFGKRAEKVETIECQTRWIDRDRFSTRTQQTHSIGGFLGRAVYGGDLTEFVPLLRLGKLVHVGKHAVWGNGRYEFECSVS